MDLQDLLGCRVDVVTTKGLRERIRSRVLKEAVPRCGYRLECRGKRSAESETKGDDASERKELIR